MESSTTSLIRPAIFDKLQGVTAAFSTREGGVSTGPYASFNLGLSTDDDEKNVWKNRWTLTGALSLTPEDLALAGQVHGDRVWAVEEARLFTGYDGLVTKRSEILLGFTAADCASVLLAEPKARVVGGCHSGWRGAVAGISAKTVAAMEEQGAETAHLHAWVSPCISERHFEVGPEVAEQFDTAYVTSPVNGENPHVDLKAAIRDQLHDAGIPQEQVQVNQQCTVGENDTFYSHRAQNGVTGRMMGVIGLKRAT